MTAQGAEPNLVLGEPLRERDPRRFDRGGRPAVMLDSCPGRGRNPSGDIQNALVVRAQVTRENRLVMCGPVAQDP